MATKPTKLPRFAELDQISPVATNNVIEPPESYKKYGHTFREKYKRNFLNWIHRYTYQWLNWLNIVSTSGSIPVDFIDTVGGTGVLHWRKFNKHVLAHLLVSAPAQWPMIAPETFFRMYPTTGNWGLIYSTVDQQSSCIVLNENYQYAGAVLIKAGITTPWEFLSPTPPSVAGFPNYRQGLSLWFGSCGFPLGGVNFNYLSSFD